MLLIFLHILFSKSLKLSIILQAELYLSCSGTIDWTEKSWGY